MERCRSREFQQSHLALWTHGCSGNRKGFQVRPVLQWFHVFLQVPHQDCVPREVPSAERYILAHGILGQITPHDDVYLLGNKCFRTRDIVFGKAFKDHLGILKKEPHSPSGQWERLKTIPRLWRSISNVNPRKNQTLPKTLHFFSSHPSSHAAFIFFFSTTNLYPKSAEGRNNKPECGGPRRLCRRATHQTSYPRA